MSQLITNAFITYLRDRLLAQQPVVLDEFVLANVPELDPDDPIDPDSGLPPVSQIVHRQAVDQCGRIHNNAVAYSIVMDTSIGDFDFNAMYLINKASGLVAMIVHKGLEKKVASDSATGKTGNSLVKTMLMEYRRASEATATHVDASTWQIDYAARLHGQDEDLRKLAKQLYGHHSFIGGGFQVVQQGGGHQVTPGVAIIGGLRIELAQPEVIYPGTKPIGVWVDVHRAGSLLAAHQNYFTIITSAADLTDHVDSNGYPHYVAKLATIDSQGGAHDDREGVSSAGFIPVVRGLWERTLHDIGMTLSNGSFEAGAKVTDIHSAVLFEKDGYCLYWNGEIPAGGKIIPQGSTPHSSGGVGEHAWTFVTDSLLDNLASNGGASIVKTLSGSSVETELNKAMKKIIAPVTVDVGLNGRFKSINEALSYISSSRSIYMQNGLSVAVSLQSDYVMDEQVIVNGNDLSWIVITSPQEIAINRAALVELCAGHYPAFAAINGGRLPLIDVKFNMGFQSGDADLAAGVVVHGAGSSVNIAPLAGVCNSTGMGIIALAGASFCADDTIWDDCAGDGVAVFGGASGSANRARADRCYNGFLSDGATLSAKGSQAKHSRSAGHAARKSGSMDAEFADSQNGDNYGFYAAISSKLNVTRGNCSGCRFGISGQRSSKISAEEVIANNCRETNISARRYAEIEAQSCQAVNTETTPLYVIRANYSGSVLVESGVIHGAIKNLLRATSNAEIQATDAKLSGGEGSSIAIYVDESSKVGGRRLELDHSASLGTAIHALRASEVDLCDAYVKAGANYGAVSQYGANISVDDAVIRGSGNYSLYATDGGKASATKADLQQVEGVDLNTNIVVSRGGIISADQAIGGTNVTPNVVSVAGVIFK